MITVAIASHKGGVGKTTTAVTLGHLLARAGHKTLVVDLDPQGSVASFLGLERGNGVQRMLIDRAPWQKVTLPASREEGEKRANLWVIPGGPTTAKADKQLTTEVGREARLRRALAGSGFDYVILDTAPSLNLLQVLAFVAADWLLVPTELSFASGEGVRQVLETVAQLRQDLELPVRLAGILPTKWDRRKGEADEQLKVLAQRFPGKVWLPIPTDAAAERAPAFGSTLVEYAPDSAAMIGREVRPGRLVGGYRAALDRLVREVGR